MNIYQEISHSNMYHTDMEIKDYHDNWNVCMSNVFNNVVVRN